MEKHPQTDTTTKARKDEQTSLWVLSELWASLGHVCWTPGGQDGHKTSPSSLLETSKLEFIMICNSFLTFVFGSVCRLTYVFPHLTKKTKKVCSRHSGGDGPQGNWMLSDGILCGPNQLHCAPAWQLFAGSKLNKAARPLHQEC